MSIIRTIFTWARMWRSLVMFRKQKGSVTKKKTARVIHCYLEFLLPTSVSILWRISVHIYISDCLQAVYELPLLPNNTASETFLHKSAAVRSVDWIFIIGAPVWRWLGECVTLGRKFYRLLWKQEAVAATVTATFCYLPHSSRRPLLQM